MRNVERVGRNNQNISTYPRMSNMGSRTRHLQEGIMMKRIPTPVTSIEDKHQVGVGNDEVGIKKSMTLKPQHSVRNSEMDLIRTRQDQALSQSDVIRSYLRGETEQCAVVLNQSGTIIGVNEHTIQMFGHTSFKELEGESVLRLLSRRGDKTSFRGILLQEMRETCTYSMSIKVGHGRRFFCKRKDGSEFLAGLATQKIYGSPFWVCYLKKESDIDESKEAK